MSINAIKLIAVLFMTFGYAAEYFKAFIPEQLYEAFYILSRASAPMFMLALINGAVHTSDRKKYLLRLYIANMIIALISLPLSTVPHLLANDVTLPSIKPQALCAYFWALLYICIIDGIMKEKEISKKICYIAEGILVTVIPDFISKYITPNIINGLDDFLQPDAARNLMNALFPNFRTAEYSVMFVVMGILMYYFSNKYAQCLIILAVSLFAYLGGSRDWTLLPFANIIGGAGYFNFYQLFMCLAIHFFFIQWKKRKKYEMVLLHILSGTLVYFIWLVNGDCKMMSQKIKLMLFRSKRIYTYRREKHFSFFLLQSTDSETRREAYEQLKERREKRGKICL